MVAADSEVAEVTVEEAFPPGEDTVEADTAVVAGDMLLTKPLLFTTVKFHRTYAISKMVPFRRERTDSTKASGVGTGICMIGR